MATWGSSSGHLDDDGENEEEDEYPSEICAEEEDREECTESSSDDDVPAFSPSMNQYSNRKNQGRSDQMDGCNLVVLTFATVFLHSFSVFVCAFSNLKPPAAFSGESGGHLPNKTEAKQQCRTLNQSEGQSGGTRRQENLCWPFESSIVDSTPHWQEQISQLQRQLDLSTSMCQTLLQDQQVCKLNKYTHTH